MADPNRDIREGPVEINIGADKGLKVGAVLEAAVKVAVSPRHGTGPKVVPYSLRVTQVNKKSAVAKLGQPLPHPPSIGDRVVVTSNGRQGP